MTIKETAGKLLLVLYSLQITGTINLEREQITFTITSKTKLRTTSSNFKNKLHKITDEDTALYNATNYLLERGLITGKDKKVGPGCLIIISPHVTYQGVDIIESVEQGEESQRAVKSLFNFSFNFSPTMKVDSLLKAEVGNIVGIGGAIGGKINI